VPALEVGKVIYFTSGQEFYGYAILKFYSTSHPNT